MSDPRPLDPAAFRAALARFASGVTILTTRTPDGRDFGMTATAFCSLSLEPPLVLACVDRIASLSIPLGDAVHLAVHVLAAGQEALSRRFADKDADRFAGLAITRGVGGLPLLEGALARLECRIAHRLPGGDHEIVIGEVLAAHVVEGDPLLYYHGQYARLDR